MGEQLSNYLYTDEAARVDALLEALPWDQARHDRVEAKASDLVERVRGGKRKSGEMESFLQQYSLTTEEGLALMGMAEALLRIPDARTAKALIRDKVGSAEWTLEGQPKDWMVKAAGLGMSITRKTLDSMVARLGEPVIRQAMVQAIRLMGHQFVVGQTINDAIKNAKPYEKKGYRMSYDMLGEGARTAEDAERYFNAYLGAVDALGAKVKPGDAGMPGISVKLSALHPRYRVSQEDKCLPALVDRLSELCKKAAAKDIAVTIDAEEVERLELSLKIIESVAANENLKGWDGLGLAVQAYSKRTLPLIDHLVSMINVLRRRLAVRLVKGAYWDTELKRAQIMGLPDYPVFTRKANTDLSYLACAHKLLGNRDLFYPMLATHNAHTIAAILEMAGNNRGSFEFQRLHGMGEALHDMILADNQGRVSVYAPVGSHQDLLPYLVRRLLENGANSNFVHQLLDPDVPVKKIVADPVQDARMHPTKRHARIPKPASLYGPQRRNSIGLDLTDKATVVPLLNEMRTLVDGRPWEAAPMIGGKLYRPGTPRSVLNPADWRSIIGTAWYADDKLIGAAFDTAKSGFREWSVTASSRRADILDRLADLMEENRAELMGLCVREAGKTVDDALAEVREGIDFCRYYAQRGRMDFNPEGRLMPGPTGERNTLHLQGRGVFVCISPWNFPLAIFIGQIAAALMAGNAVIAKPAEQTPLIAMRMAKMLLEAGVHPDAFTLLPGDGAVGAQIVQHRDVAGVAFTGSTDAARSINRALAEKDGPIVPLIAETGGQNVMIVDSSALPEQVVDDVIVSAFGSAGQRCSALRVLYLQDDIADKTIHMLYGAMQEIRIGDPMEISSDLGPVIDDEALAGLIEHRAALDGFGKKIAEVPLEESLKQSGHFFAPVAYEIKDIAELKREVFGPILHIVRYKAGDIDRIIRDVNATGYGLTLGIHTRIAESMDKIACAVNVGNAYINRTMIGAVVGVQPFGGQGLSGTGPKAGGPHYLHRFATEKVITVNTTASGGNASLVTLEE
jgi:RHH-type proline utilization regulon transcriptional repressor/proline dehydrogenase/delta 1-pyrroline-5-carboxylate dehydrogenase